MPTTTRSPAAQHRRSSRRVGTAVVTTGTVAARTADRRDQLTWRSRPSQYGARSLNFWSLPVAVRESSGTKSMLFGHL
jgi:hypothetical protein